MKKNRPLIVDFDSTLVNSQKAVCEIYNNMYKNHPDFVPANWESVNTWNFSDQCPLIDDIMKIFNGSDFFRVVEFYEGARETLKELSEVTEVYVCTAGTSKNISHKVLWLEKNLPFAHIVPVIIKGADGYGKKIVNMENAIFIDDHSHNLVESNAHIKILYGRLFPWNKDWKGLRMLEWNENFCTFLRWLITN